MAISRHRTGCAHSSDMRRGGWRPIARQPGPREQGWMWRSPAAAREALGLRLDEELRAFLGICEKRLSAKEEQIRGVGEALQATADGISESLSRRGARAGRSRESAEPRRRRQAMARIVVPGAGTRGGFTAHSSPVVSQDAKSMASVSSHFQRCPHSWTAGPMGLRRCVCVRNSASVRPLGQTSVVRASCLSDLAHGVTFSLRYVRRSSAWLSAVLGSGANEFCLFVCVCVCVRKGASVRPSGQTYRSSGGMRRSAGEPWPEVCVMGWPFD